MTRVRKVCAIGALSMIASGAAYADASANIGIMSDYIYRGLYQSEASAFGGMDITTDSGFYMGTWGTNLKDGLEYDVYLGYEGGGENFTWNVGFTGYYYTDEFDHTYEELNLGFSYGFPTIDYALGDYKTNTAISSGGQPEQTYQYVGATFAPEVGPYYFVGRTDYKSIGRADPTSGAGRIPGTAANGDWFEIGKSFEIMDDLELAVAALFSGDVPQANSTTPATVRLGQDSDS